MANLSYADLTYHSDRRLLDNGLAVRAPDHGVVFGYTLYIREVAVPLSAEILAQTFQ